MRIQKRNGQSVDFNRGKIENAIIKAMKYGSGRVDQEVAIRIAIKIEKHFKEKDQQNITIADVEKLVFFMLCEESHKDTARSYESFRSIREHQRKVNTTDKGVVGLVTGENKEALQENANKRGELISTQAQLIYEEISKDIAYRLVYPPHIVEAHKSGKIHQHDLGHTLTKNINCCLVDLEGMLGKGTVINGRMVEKPKSFRTACTVATQVIAQIASSQHGLKLSAMYK